MEPEYSSGGNVGTGPHRAHLRGVTGPVSAPGELRDRIYQDLKDEVRHQNRLVRKRARFYDGIPYFSPLNQ